MTIGAGRANVLRMRTQSLAVACLLVPWMTGAQGLTGALVGTVTDAAGGVISGAVIRISSPALIGGELTTKTDERGQLRFPSVPPGSYVLEIVLDGFRPYRDADIRIGAGATIERTPVLMLAALADSVVVHGSGSRLDARDPGFGTRFGAEDLDAIPMRRFSYQDWVKMAPGISPTSPAGSSVLISALGSGVDQNQYLLDGTSITATGNGVSRAEPGVILLGWGPGVLLAMIVHDRRTLGRIHPATLCGGLGLMIAGNIQAVVIGPSQTWQRIVAWLAG